MGTNRSRRNFFSAFIKKNSTDPSNEKVKMLTADGKLVEVDKAIFEKAAEKQKTTNKDIYDWMKNPSKKQG